MLKAILILLVGVLVGANLVYFVMHRDRVPADTVVFDTAPTPPTSSVPATSDRDASVASADDAPGVAVQPPSESVPTPTRTRDETAPAPSAPFSAAELPADLLLPVQGILPESLSNTFDDARGTGRRHDALDIMAPRGTPVLAVADGKVEKLFDSERGGLTIYQFEPSDRYSYYYAHLDRYAPGLKEGQSVSKGEVIAYVGSTGNASADAPHLHFAIFRLGPKKRWSSGEAINPYPVLTGKPAAVAQPH